MDKVFNTNDAFFTYFVSIGGVFLCHLIYRFLHTILADDNFMETTYKTNGHTWRSVQCNRSIPYNVYCTICNELLFDMNGLFCECCAISACKKCYKTLDKQLKCKQTTWTSDKPFLHHWVNITVGTLRCSNAEDEKHNKEKLFCSWCQRVKLCSNKDAIKSEPCDFQKYKNIIIPPACVQLDKKTGFIIKPILDSNWEPLIVLGNRKSGSSRSDEILSLFRGLLNPIQVVDLSVTTPEKVVRWLPPKCRILVCGGDGTVAWVLNALVYATDVQAAVAILPMGTGNDLSRVLGWGPGCPSYLDAAKIIKSIMKAHEQPLDRWKVTIKPKRSRIGRLRPERVLYAYNYASIGVDAQVALDFHRARTQFLYRYASRTLNYVAYAFMGVNRALDDGGCYGLERRLRVWVDDETEPMSLPPLQSLVALNIPSWGAGVDLWRLGKEDEVPEQSICDGALEVVGISSSFHIARLQCGLAEPFRFMQTSYIRIELQGTCAMQVDGEPWMQGSATIIIEPAGQCLMLRANNIHSELSIRES